MLLLLNNWKAYEEYTGTTTFDLEWPRQVKAKPIQISKPSL